MESARGPAPRWAGIGAALAAQIMKISAEPVYVDLLWMLLDIVRAQERARSAGGSDDSMTGRSGGWAERPTALVRQRWSHPVCDTLHDDRLEVVRDRGDILSLLGRGFCSGRKSWTARSANGRKDGRGELARTDGEAAWPGSQARRCSRHARESVGRHSSRRSGRSPAETRARHQKTSQRGQLQRRADPRALLGKAEELT